MKVWSFVVLSLIVAWSEVSVATATLYRWQNERGQMHYSTSPPITPVQNLEVKRNNRWYPYIPGAAVRPSPRPRTSKTVKTVVAYKQHKGVIIIRVILSDGLERLFAVDTGASYTVITPEMAEALHLAPNSAIPPITLQTANGRIQAPLVNLKTVTVGDITTHNVAAAIHRLHDDVGEISGLLGLNFLNRFTMTVDATRHQLTFEANGRLSEYKTRDCVAAREWLARGEQLNDHSATEASYYRKATALCADLLEAYYRLGAVYYHQKDYQRAVEIHRQITRMHPDEAEAHYRLGVLYALERNFLQAKQEFQMTLHLDPGHQQASEYLQELKNY